MHTHTLDRIHVSQKSSSIGILGILPASTTEEKYIIALMNLLSSRALSVQGFLSVCVAVAQLFEERRLLTSGICICSLLTPLNLHDGGVPVGG